MFFENEGAARRFVALLRANPDYEITLGDFNPPDTGADTFTIEHVEDWWYVIGSRGANTPRGVPGARYIAAIADSEREARAELARFTPPADTHFPNGTVDHGSTVTS